MVEKIFTLLNKQFAFLKKSKFLGEPQLSRWYARFNTKFATGKLGQAVGTSPRKLQF
jgi:hypothetical protein